VKRRTQKQDSRIIVYDADEIEQADASLFDEADWKTNGGLIGRAGGRGSALLLETPFGPAVLRRYLRGGWAARLSKDRYWFTGYKRSRPIAEFDILIRLQELGLPVPHPLAALCQREGLMYTGSLMTRRILNAQPFLEYLLTDPGGTPPWSAVGRCIREFHRNGVVHADLNAGNILVDKLDQVYLIDFDRAEIKRGSKWFYEANLRRLRRSLDKHCPVGRESWLSEGWEQLLKSYYDVAGTPS
jgi:3-deoxy-D-manno-octulosonic acid kinase